MTQVLTCTPKIPNTMKNAQQMRTMFPMGLKDVIRVSTTSFRPGARLITLPNAKSRSSRASTADYHNPVDGGTSLAPLTGAVAGFGAGGGRGGSRRFDYRLRTPRRPGCPPATPTLASRPGCSSCCADTHHVQSRAPWPPPGHTHTEKERAGHTCPVKWDEEQSDF